MMMRHTESFMWLFRSYRPVIAKVHGYAVAGGSDIALCSDFVVMAEDARIGYMPARVWGCPTTMMWVYRLGAENAKRMLFTGDAVTAARQPRWAWCPRPYRPPISMPKSRGLRPAWRACR